jgi:glycosyl transferase family 25
MGSNSSFEDIVFSTYIIDHLEDGDNETATLWEFSDRSEFDIKQTDAVGWAEAVSEMARAAIAAEDEIIILCKKGHRFTMQYSRSLLMQNILEAHRQKVDILCGGIERFTYAVPITKNRYWIDRFDGAGFIVLFKKVFPALLNAGSGQWKNLDALLSKATPNKMVLYPFISRNTNYAGANSPELIPAEKQLATYDRMYEKYVLKNAEGSLSHF